MIQAGEIECGNTGDKIRSNELWEEEETENICADFIAERFKPLGHLPRGYCSDGKSSTSVKPEIELICKLYCSRDHMIVSIVLVPNSIY